MEKIVNNNLKRALNMPVIERENQNSDINELDILAQYTEQQQSEIIYKKQILSTLACFIGKDFNIPVEINQPNSGWHWDFENNIIRIDPEDLLNKHMDYLRYIISHEGGHRRITRVDFIENGEWRQPGFSFMMNAIEDPRVDNFISEISQQFQAQKDDFYEVNIDNETESSESNERPLFIQAGLEYIKQWHRESQGLDFVLSENLPQQVKDVVSSTIAAAKESWWRYPSRQEADASEEAIEKYALKSYEINRDVIWPQFKKLVEIDLENQSIKEYAKDLNQANENEEIDTDNLSDDMRQYLNEQINTLSPNHQKELFERSMAELGQIEQDFNDILGGKLVFSSKNNQVLDNQDEMIEIENQPDSIESSNIYEIDETGLNNFKQYLEKELQNNLNDYEKIRRPLIPLIDQLESDLREIFVARKNHGWQSDFRTGQKIDIGKRIQEKARSIPVIDSKSWKKRELPDEKDYAISVLVDLSGTMGFDRKINETFDGVVVLTEALSRLSINHEIVGFNSRFHEYKKFNEQITKDIRNKMTGMLGEVRSNNAGYTDDGWALTQASERLVDQKNANQKILIVLSDGRPNESPEHDRPEYALRNVINLIESDTDIRLIGLGVGRGTEHVNDYYRESIANVRVKEMTNKLAGIIVDAIAK